MKPDNNISSSHTVEDGIDLIGLAKTLWKGKTTMIWFLVIFTGLGVFVALFSPVEYTAKTVFVPQIQSKTTGLGGLGSLAAMAGFNLDALPGASSELSPTVYPQIVSSTPFQKSIMHTPLTWEGQTKQYSLLYYYDSIYTPKPVEFIKKHTIGLPGVILSWLKGDARKKEVVQQAQGSLITVSQEEKDMSKILNKRLSISLNSKEGYITLTVIAPEALAAAQMAQTAQQLLQNQVIEYKINKARQNLIFVQSLLKEKETDFLNAQSDLASYRDKNINLMSAMAKTEEEKLQSHYTLTFSVYNEVAKQLENAKIKVKEDTPTFSIIEPVSIPTQKSKPKKAVILGAWFFMGLVGGAIWVMGRHSLGNVRKKWAQVQVD